MGQGIDVEATTSLSWSDEFGLVRHLERAANPMDGLKSVSAQMRRPRRADPPALASPRALPVGSLMGRR